MSTLLGIARAAREGELRGVAGYAATAFASLTSWQHLAGLYQGGQVLP